MATSIFVLAGKTISNYYCFMLAFYCGNKVQNMFQFVSVVRFPFTDSSLLLKCFGFFACFVIIYSLSYDMRAVVAARQACAVN